MNYKEEILKLHNARYAIIKSKNSKSREKEIDKYTEDITNLLKEGFDTLEFDFIIEQLSFLGEAPCLLYDDNGNWAVSSDAYSSISLEVSDWEGSFFVEKKCWKETPKEALRYFLFNEEDNSEEENV